jgi:hypothetical protein
MLNAQLHIGTANWRWKLVLAFSIISLRRSLDINYLIIPFERYIMQSWTSIINWCAWCSSVLPSWAGQKTHRHMVGNKSYLWARWTFTISHETVRRFYTPYSFRLYDRALHCHLHSSIDCQSLKGTTFKKDWAVSIFGLWQNVFPVTSLYYTAT